MRPRHVFNLCFHGIGTPMRELEAGEGRYWITPQLFTAILDEVAGRDDVSLSFDDGNASDVVHGLPALTDRGLDAIFFPLAGRLDRPGSLSGTDLQALRAAGMAIGTHGFAHRPWRHLDQSDQERELVQARWLLSEASQGPVDQAALPLGRYDRRLLSVLHGHGYRHVYSSDRTPARAGSWLQPRYSIQGGDSISSVRDLLAGQRVLQRAAAVTRTVVKRLR